MSGITNALNTFTNSSVNSFDPTTTAMSSVQQTLSGLGGGLGGVLLSIPGVGKPTVDALNSLRKRSQDLLANARSMTPSKVKEENDKINQEYDRLVETAKAKGETPPPRQTILRKTQASISTFFKDVFSTTLNIILFFSVIVLGLIGSSMAANSIGPGMPFYYYVYYMIYGFLLFPISIVLGLIRFYIKKKKPLFYAVLAPIIKGSSMGIFQYNLVSTNIVHYVSESTAKVLPSELVIKPKVEAPIETDTPDNEKEETTISQRVSTKNSSNNERVKFEPTRVGSKS